MILTLMPPAPPDPYQAVRFTMAACLEELADSVLFLSAAVLNCAAPRTEFSAISAAVEYAKAAADKFAEFDNCTDLYEMFNALEHGAMSISNMVMLLRSLEPAG